MANEPKELNGIPTAYHFKWKLGRTWGSFRFRKVDAEIERICNALKRAEAYRGITHMTAIERLREVRQECYRFGTQIFNWEPKRDQPKVDELRERVSERINAVAEQIIGIHRDHDEDTLNQRIFNTFYTDLPNILQAGVGRKLDTHYQLERVNSMRLPQSKMQSWVDSTSRLGYRNWYNTVHRWESEDQRIGGYVLAPMEDKRLWYLSDLEREAFRVNIRGGRVYEIDNSIYHSGQHSSQSGRGWSIYTMGFNGNLYLGGHRVDEFHHSSFFGGRPVMAAGEIAVNQGQVVGVTNKTGHYKAGPRELCKMLETLQQGGVNLANIVVTDPFRTAGRWFSGAAALGAQGNLVALGNNTVPAPPLPIVP